MSFGREDCWGKAMASATGQLGMATPSYPSIISLRIKSTSIELARYSLILFSDAHTGWYLEKTHWFHWTCSRVWLSSGASDLGFQPCFFPVTLAFYAHWTSLLLASQWPTIVDGVFYFLRTFCISENSDTHTHTLVCRYLPFVHGCCHSVYISRQAWVCCYGRVMR